ncbi:MAG: acyl carrier protein [Bacteroidota bacterium]
MEEIKNKVIKILDKYIFDKTIWDRIPENPRIIFDLKINSARIVDIIIDIEEEYDLEFDNKSLQKSITLNDIIEVIRTKTGK